MRISVIVPAFNESATLVAFLENLVCRTDIDDIIIVDASRRSTVVDFYRKSSGQLLDFAGKGVRFVGSPCAGRALQMNLGAELAAGDVLLFLHVDTRLPPMDLRSEFGKITGWGRFNVKLDHPAWWAAMIGFMMNLRSRMTGIATGDQAIFVCREVWCTVGGYPPLSLMEDVALSSRLKKISDPICLSTPVVTSARRWERGVAKTIALMWMLRFLFWCGADTTWLSRLYRHVR